MNPVLDASAFIAAISPTERRHALAKARLAAQPEATPFLVPAIFRTEVIAGLARRGEPVELLDTADAVVRGPRFCACALDEALLAESVRVARSARLRAYDAIYVALALSRRQPLVTFDDEVRTRGRAAFPDLQVFDG